MVSGEGVIHSDTAADVGSAHWADTRTRSRSVRMPTASSPSTTTTEPTPRSSMRSHVEATVSEGATVRTSVVMTSFTVRLMGPSATPTPSDQLAGDHATQGCGPSAADPGAGSSRPRVYEAPAGPPPGGGPSPSGDPPAAS